jgi:hypothetical protein
VKARPGNGRRSRDPALDQPILLSEPLIAPALPSQGAVSTGEVVTTGYGKTSNAGFPNERRDPARRPEHAALGDVVIGIVS